MLVGFETSDDAAVYRVTPDIALISTVDYITPPVNDPYWFGQIAAANSLSDVYAMGGKPLTALNLVMFPSQKLDMGFLKEILRFFHVLPSNKNSPSGRLPTGAAINPCKPK